MHASPPCVTPAMHTPAMHAPNTSPSPAIHASLPHTPPLPCAPSTTHTSAMHTKCPAYPPPYMPLPHTHPLPCMPSAVHVHPPDRILDTCLRKHYLSATVAVDGEKNLMHKLLTWSNYGKTGLRMTTVPFRFRDGQLSIIHPHC